MINSTPYASGLSPNSGIYRPAFSKTKYKYGAAETRMTYHKYDAVGNPVFQSKDNVSRVCYLWSYDRLYPIAQIINASYDTVEAILTGPAIDNFATLAAPSYAQINTFVNQLRNDPRMSKAMITSYSYDPLFGMTSETDVNGKTTYYEYDYLGRLHVVKDKDLNVVKVICYNYAGQATDCSIQRLTGSRLFYYGSTKTTACSAPGAPPQTVQIKAAYYRSQIAGIDSGTIKYYRDAAMTQLLETGYYVDSPATVSGSTLYYYIVNGEVIYTATCGSADPFLLGYRTTWQSSNMCDGTFPIEAIFTLGQAPLVLNAYCFSDPQLTTHVADGYYILEDKYYHIVSGQVVSVDYCQPPSTKVLVRDPNFQDVCDAQTFGTYTVYYRGAFDEGTVLYANSAMTTTLGRGHYSDRSSVITVNSNGSISIKMTCTEAANLPPSQVPAPIP
jgi:YD repeat-containing protein